jgi:hypothetical protein
MCAWREFQIVLTALCLLLVSPFSAFATSIVTIIGGESITIAADGVLIGTSTETGEPVRDSTCKIRCIHHLCFAASGRYGNKTIGYNIFELAGKELSRPGVLKKSLRDLGLLLSLWYQNLLPCPKRKRRKSTLNG